MKWESRVLLVQREIPVLPAVWESAELQERLASLELSVTRESQAVSDLQARPEYSEQQDLVE